MARHQDQVQASKMVGEALKVAQNAGILTDAIVAAGDTVALLIAGVRAVTPSHASMVPIIERTVEAIKTGEALGDFTSGLLAPLTTVAGLLALTAYDATVPVAIMFHE